MKELFFSIMVLVISTCAVNAQQPAIFMQDGKAIRGYDPVAFFTVGKPVRGKERFSYHWKDATWLFSSKANLDSFSNNPEKYAPQYGGYCAYGCSQGHNSPTDVNTFTIVDHKLYFNYNKEVQAMWLKDQSLLIKQADSLQMK